MINWKRYPSSSNPSIYICPNCQGRGTIYTKWRQKISCPSCMGNKYLKECNSCKSMMQIEDDKCLECILKLDNIEVTI